MEAAQIDSFQTSKIQDQTKIDQEQTRIRDEIADAINTDFEQSEIEQIPINEMYLGGGQNDIEQEQTRFCDEILQEQTRICDEIADAINTNIEQLATVEETFGFWLSRREETIEKLEDIATHIDSFTKKTSLAKAIGSGTGILGGGLTVIGGGLTIAATGGIAAVPILLAGAGIGIAGGLTGGTATISEKVVNSKQMKVAKEALINDQECSLELQSQIEALSKNEKFLKTMAVEMGKSGGKVSIEGYHIAKLVGISSSNLIGQGLTVAAGAFSNEAAKAVSKALLVASGRTVTGAFSIIAGGVTMIYDIYQLSGEIDTLVKKGSAESATQIRSIAAQLNTNLLDMILNCRK